MSLSTLKENIKRIKMCEISLTKLVILWQVQIVIQIHSPFQPEASDLEKLSTRMLVFWRRLLWFWAI